MDCVVSHPREAFGLVADRPQQVLSGGPSPVHRRVTSELGCGGARSSTDLFTGHTDGARRRGTLPRHPG